MKKLLVFCCFVTCLFASAQSNDTTKYTPVNGYGYNYKRLKIDSSLMLALGDTTSKAPRQIKFVGNNIFYSDNAGVWHAMASGGGGGGTGISNIYTRGDSLFYTLNGSEYFINAYFSRDSADARYYSITNPAGYLTSAAIAGKLNYTDTALMLNPYLHKTDTSNMLAPYLKTAAGDARYPLLSGSYNNPAWLSGLGWAKLTGTPTTLGGYGITDAYSNTNPAGYITNSALSGYVPSSTTLTINGTAYDLSANRSWTVSGGLPSQTGNAGRYLTTDGSNASWSAVSASGAEPHYYGTIYNKNSWSDFGDFVENNVTAAVSGNKINITSGTGLSTLDYNYFSELDHWSNAVKIKATSTTAIAGIGIHSHSTWQGFSVYAKLNFSTGALTIVNANTLPSYAETTLATATSSLTVSTNDYVLITIERDVDSIFATARDITSGSNFIKVAYGYQINNTNNSTPNTGMYAVYAGGGSFTIDSMAVNSNEIVNSNLLITTDSKGEYVVNSFQGRWTQQVSNLYYPTVLSVGGTEGVNELLNRIPEIVILNPKSVLILLGRNDQNFSMNSDTLHNRYSRAVGYLQAAGIIVYHLNEIYETALNLSGLSNWKNTTFAGYVIDTYDPTSQIGNPLLYSDDAHQIQAGHDLVAKIVIQSGFFNNGLNYANAVRLAIPDYPIHLNKFGGNQFIGDAGNNTLTSATNNIAWGTSAAASLTTGSANINIGMHAGQSITSDNMSIYLGNYAGYLNQGAKYNIFIGDHAGINALDVATHIEASRNIFIGAWSGSNTGTNGNDNVFIGNYAGINLGSNVANTFVLAGGSTSGTGGSYGTGSGGDVTDLMYGNFNNGQMRIGKGATYPALVAGVALDVVGGALKLPATQSVTPVEGMMFYQYSSSGTNSGHKLYWYNGTSWTSNVLTKQVLVSTSTANSICLPNTFTILNPTTTLSSLVIGSLGGGYAQDNDIIEFVATKAISGVTYYFADGGGGAGQCVNCPTSLTPGMHYRIYYNAADGNWY